MSGSGFAAGGGRVDVGHIALTFDAPARQVAVVAVAAVAAVAVVERLQPSAS